MTKGDLSFSACRVFVALYRAGGRVSSASELQSLSKVRDRDTFYVAVRQLADEGLMDTERGLARVRRGRTRGSV